MQKLLQLFKTKIIQIITFGLSPVQLGLTLSFGITLGLFPFIGLTSILCFVFAFVFRLNWVVIQLVNWVVSPLQLIMLVPFYQFGLFIKHYFSSTNEIVIEKIKLANQSFFEKIFFLINSQILAILGWTVICVPFALLVHFISLYFYKNYLKRKKITL